MGESNACGSADAPPAEAGTTYRNTGSSGVRWPEAKMRIAGLSSSRIDSGCDFGFLGSDEIEPDCARECVTQSNKSLNSLGKEWFLGKLQVCWITP